MGRKANPAVIGAFVVGAIALAVVGVLVFGSGRLFRQVTELVCFFSGDVNGLNVGAPVKFKGVEVGSVVDIRLRIEGQPEADAMQVSQGIRIPVIIELDDRKLSARGAIEFDDPERLKAIIDLGLRAQLAAQSFVTGLLFVQLDFRPDTPATLILPPDSDYPEIPTIPTALEQVRSAAEMIVARIDKLDIEGFVRSAKEAVDGINQMVNAPALKATIEALPETVTNMNKAVSNVRDLAGRLDSHVEPLVGSLKEASRQTDETLEQARVTMQTVQTLVDPGSPLAGQLTITLQELSGAARSVRLLADYIERNPSALVRGKDVNDK